MVMFGFGSGGVLTGKITDRYGIVTAIGLGIGILGLGYVGAGWIAPFPRATAEATVMEGAHGLVSSHMGTSRLHQRPERLD
jgi:MFS family permease